MRKRFTVIILSHFLVFSSIQYLYSQREANIWLFDKNLGIDFNDNKFTSFNTQVDIDQYGATAVMCHKQNGKLLFFTNGRSVWNASFEIMRNGTSLKGGKYTHQAALIVPFPGNANQYLLFTTKSSHDPYPEGEAGLYYNIVDMSRSNGLGEIVVKNQVLNINASEKLIAVPHENGIDYWLISHEGTSDRFIIIPITTNGMGSPRLMAYGPTYDIFKAKGWLQASPDGTMIACGVSSDGITRNPLELYDFDAATGELSNRIELGEYPELTGVAFSPNNRLLYFTHSDQLQGARGYLSQVNLKAGSTQDIISSRKDLYALHDPFPDNPSNGYDTVNYSVLQLAPDGRLYLKFIVPYRSPSNSQSANGNMIYFVNKPNLLGFDSEPMGRDFHGNFGSSNLWSFPNFMTNVFNGLEPENNIDGENCTEKSITVYPNPVTELLNVDFLSACEKPLLLTIYNAVGQIVSQNLISEPFYTINMVSQTPGIYFAVFMTQGRIITRKVIKK